MADPMEQIRLVTKADLLLQRLEDEMDKMRDLGVAEVFRCPLHDTSPRGEPNWHQRTLCARFENGEYVHVTVSAG